ncbi:YggL family protein [Achromobacter mucicolens]|uniref:YggL family protein n=2 Tax=Achromobacter mucicolens TaxID=1389922 RepID=A0ABD4YWN4_9BURK|nr:MULTISPECIES: 50S ribosome-binding protein YggL [Achromobacter]MDH1179410.1 YggL family protein [Achromobacter mucicolens]UDG75380.1 DUF469 family protein [Achromobacter sp. 77]WGJ90309.1 50S ribosome-binding protein YggL [Achromobacter mucicolens]CAB3872442.1 hypothetical protein LMG26684_03149 [Achromobacter mucicolens]
MPGIVSPARAAACPIASGRECHADIAVVHRGVQIPSHLPVFNAREVSVRKYRSIAPVNGRLRRLNRRQRKKLHVGEFQDCLFEVRGSLVSDIDDGDALLDAFIAWIESCDLYFAGYVGRGRIDGMVLTSVGSPTEAQRQSVVRWFKERPEVAEVEAGEFRDAFYGYE